MHQRRNLHIFGGLLCGTRRSLHIGDAPGQLDADSGASFSSVCSTSTPAFFSMASSTTMAGDQPPISTKATAP